MLYADGILYDGEWIENDRDGYGILISPFGFKFVKKYFDMGLRNFEQRYEGYFKFDKLHGKGTLYLPKGEKYEGEWQNNKMNGKGVLTFFNNDKYEGNFKNDLYNGQGKFTWFLGDTYEG
jgi:hypothetical protein